MIKNVRPSGRYKHGYMDPRSSTKYIQTGEPIIYRSSYEKKFIQWLEQSPSVLRWSSEPVGIPYTMDGKSHTYYPDFYAETRDGVYMFEIKPLSQTRNPKNDYEAQQYRKNCYKWQAAKQWCEDRDMKFRIITEHTLNKL